MQVKDGSPSDGAIHKCFAKKLFQNFQRIFLSTFLGLYQECLLGQFGDFQRSCFIRTPLYGCFQTFDFSESRCFENSVCSFIFNSSKAAGCRLEKLRQSFSGDFPKIFGMHTVDVTHIKLKVIK